MLIAHVVTIPADDTGYSLRTLLENAGVSFADGRPVRFATLKISQISTNVDSLFVVPATGAYSATANVPDNYGWNFSAFGGLWEMQLAVNAIGIDDIVLGGVQDETAAVFMYTV